MDMRIEIKPVKMIYKPSETQRLIQFFTFESMKDEVLYSAQAQMDKVQEEVYSIREKVRSA
jgi:hypothetical protein